MEGGTFYGNGDKTVLQGLAVDALHGLLLLGLPLGMERSCCQWGIAF
jgi:hypothetical protein